jgi:hypothetical protein
MMRALKRESFSNLSMAVVTDITHGELIDILAKKEAS